MMSELQAALPVPERLTWSEICQRYPDEWVVLIETKWIDADNFEFNTALVLGHSINHGEVLRRTRPLREHVMESGIYFTGCATPLVPSALQP